MSTPEHGQQRAVLNVNETSEYLRLSRRTVYAYAGSHLLPHVRAGRRLLFRRVDLDRWLDDRLVPAE